MNNKHDCSCNDSYEETKKLIGEANKNIRFCYAKGPTGPTGPQGESGIQGLRGEIGPTGPRGEDGGATIEVGITETVDLDTEALVTNVGTNKEVVLNFKIPKGSPGVEGKIGPTGPNGEQGDVGPQGEKGETGPVGPQGPAGQVYGLEAYGYRFAHSNQRFNVVAGM